MKKAAIKKKSVKNSNKEIQKDESLVHKTAGSSKQIARSETSNGGYSQRILRPRKKSVTYKDSSNLSILLEKSISPQKRHCIVLLEKIDDSNKTEHKPIYKTVKLDKSTENKNSVYDFQFDVNDSREKLPKTRKKKKVTRKPATTRKKKAPPIRKNNNNKPPEEPKQSSKIDPILTSQTLEPIHSNIQNAVETTSPPFDEQETIIISPKNVIPTEKIEAMKPRVRINKIETLTGTKKVSFKPNLSPISQSSAKFNPFRSTQSIFRPRSTMIGQDMMEHSLLNKSLSPIRNDVEIHLDAASPWRSPVPDKFSSVKQIVQSTPENKQNLGRITQGFRPSNKSNDENDENAGAKASVLVRPSIKKSPTPLGVRILNEDNIQASSSKKIVPTSALETYPSTSTIGSGKTLLDIPKNNEHIRKNVGFGDRLYISPRKFEKPSTSKESQKSKKKNNPLPSRGKAIMELLPQKKVCIIHEDENLPPSEEQKLLEQSNEKTLILNEIPEIITTNTSHGIFGEAHSTPIVRSKTSRICKEANINNCFGFDDDCYSDDQISPIRLVENKTTPAKNTFDRLKRHDLSNDKPCTARISLGEIKNTLYPGREKKITKLKRIPEIQTAKKKKADIKADEENKEQRNNTKSKNTSNALQFSDTFDVLSINEESEENDKSTGNEFVLFADLEPVHFTKPPRWSYIKKRERKQYWSSDDDDDENEVKQAQVPVLKKRKLAKIKEVEAKKIDEWVKSVNDTFQEIDDFDLVVEKLT